MPSLQDIGKQLTEKANVTASLVVARKGAASELDAREVNLATDADGRFRDLCRDAIDDVSQRTSCS